MITAPAPSHPVKTRLPDEFYDGGPPHPLATFLGLFSIGLGLAETFAPRSFAKFIGARSSSTLIQAYGVREMTAGLGILASRQPAGWLWGRVAGDAMDLATLGMELANADGERRDRLLAATAAVAGVTVLDIVSAQANS